MATDRRRALALGALLLAASVPALPAASPRPAVRIGYFHGGRTHLFYRAFMNRCFRDEGVDVRLYTRFLRGSKLVALPKTHEEFRTIWGRGGYFGRMIGPDIVAEMEKGNLDGGTIGEASFISAVARGVPIVAVAALGHDTKEKPGHGFVLRKGLVVRKPDDLKGMTFTARRAGPVDELLLREFVLSEGLRLNDVKLVSGVYDDELFEKLASGEVQGGFQHLHWIIRFLAKDVGYLYRRLDWVDPEASLAVLVFRKDFLKSHRESAQKIVNAYVRRIRFEKSLSDEERKKPKEFGLQMENDDIPGMNIPQCDLPPVIRVELLELIQGLMLKHGFLSRKADLRRAIDHGFVAEAMTATAGR